MKYFDFIYCCFVSDEPFEGWFDEIAVAAIQLAFLCAAMFGITVVFGKPLVSHIGVAAVSTLFIVCKVGRWMRTLSEKQIQKLISAESEMTFAQALANPEMARDLIAGYKLKPTDPGGAEYITRILSADIGFLKTIATINADWLRSVGSGLARQAIKSGKRPDRFIELSSGMTWKMALSILNSSVVRPIEYSESEYCGLRHYDPIVIAFWKSVETVKSMHCQTEPEESGKVLQSEPKQEFRDGYLLSIVQKKHECASYIAKFHPEIATTVSRIAPEYALEIAKALPDKAVEIAAAVPEAFR